MTHHILLSIDDDDRVGTVIDGITAKLQEFGLDLVPQSERSGLTHISIVPAPAETAVEPVEEPQANPAPTPAEVAAAELPEPAPEPANVPAIEIPVKFEGKCQIPELSTSHEFLAETSQNEMSTLVAANVDVTSPGFVSFSVAGFNYRFPTTEACKISAAVNANGKKKRVKFQVVEANDENQLTVGTVIFGASDAELLTTEA